MDEYTAFVKALGKRLKDARKETGMSQGDFADHLGMSKSAYIGYEHGWHAMNAWQLRQTCETLGVGADDLLGLDGADDGVGGMEGE